eukprot:PhF_6_TR15109/c0_g1_i1/m.23792
MTVSQYESLYLTEVMLPSGKLLQSFDPSVGGWHEGDMREFTGKILISQGIDNANYGKWSSGGDFQDHPYTAAQLTAHNSIGNYSNGIQVHGGSGGDGIVTLDSSVGNEMSHECGHNYGLGHYNGGFNGSVHHPANIAGSTWGWDSEKNWFIPSFDGTQTGTSTCCCPDTVNQCENTFLNFSFNVDAMAGGSPTYTFANRYTLYSPFSDAQIQTFFEGKAVFAADSPTGFRRWNATSRRMEVFSNTVETAKATTSQVGNVTYMTNLLINADVVSVTMGDGNWLGRIAVPSAAQENNGKVIKIDQQAGYSTTLTINNQNFTLSKGSQRTYRSNGTWWTIISSSEIVGKIPQQFGVKVTTIVGYYDPNMILPGYIFPALHGSYGFLYSDDTAQLTNPQSQCSVVIQTDKGERKFKLSTTRLSQGNAMNKFHVHVAQEDNARVASVYCFGQQLATKQLKLVQSTLTWNTFRSQRSVVPSSSTLPTNSSNSTLPPFPTNSSTFPPPFPTNSSTFP